MSFKSEGFKRYSLLTIIGGALGNLHDRIFFNAVPDFIDFHIGNFHWFIFNVADIFITAGVISMIIFEILSNNKQQNDSFKKFISLNIVLMLCSCGTIKEGFTNQKKNSSDDFLGRKKITLSCAPKLWRTCQYHQMKKLIKIIK
jgi:hypothetical protein